MDATQPTFTVSLITSQYGNPLPQVKVTGFALDAYRLRSAALYRFAADVEIASAGRTWAACADTYEGRLWIELAGDSDAERNDALNILARVAAKHAAEAHGRALRSLTTTRGQRAA
jgi:hypothetical protein